MAQSAIGMELLPLVHTLPQCQPNLMRIQPCSKIAYGFDGRKQRFDVHTGTIDAAWHHLKDVIPCSKCYGMRTASVNFCLHSCQAISDGERSWRKSHGCLCAQLETAAQVRQTKHTGVQKTDGKKPGPLRGCQRSENTRNHWNTHDMYMDIDIMMYQTPIKTTTKSTI